MGAITTMNDYSNVSFEERPMGVDVSHDDWFDILSSSRRRQVLEALQCRETPIPLEALAANVARNEGECEESDAMGNRNVGISLHHNHLPRMDRVGLIRYDPLEKLVTSSYVQDS
jgi:hypothetical protein